MQARTSRRWIVVGLVVHALALATVFGNVLRPSDAAEPAPSAPTAPSGLASAADVASGPAAGN